MKKLKKLKEIIRDFFGTHLAQNEMGQGCVAIFISPSSDWVFTEALQVFSS
jgi:hypothetical protein